MQGGRQNTEKIPAGDTGKNMRFILTSQPKSDNILKQSVPACIKYGGIAQLGERLNGIQEVSGSIPLISTTKKS